MIRKKTVVFPGAFFCAWNGGIKLIKSSLESILNYDKKKHFNYILLLPDRNLISFLKRYNYILKSFFLNIFKGRIVFDDWHYYIGAKELRSYFEKKQKKNFSIIGVDYRNEKKYLKKKPFINIFSMNTLYVKNKIGYIFDFQHRYLPNFFSKREIIQRNLFLKKILNNNDQIIVNSLSVKKDAYKFYSKFRTKIKALPFAPFLDCNLNELLKINIKQKFKYFIICNQFWRHKNYETPIIAFKKLFSKNIKLIITGQLDKNRNLNYFDSIKNKVNELGLNDKVLFYRTLKKKEQLSLIKNSIGLIQPSLFEGGPGGFSSYEAISLGKPLLISNIKVNKEIKYKHIYFFKKNNPDDLKNKMKLVLKKKSNLSKKDIILNSKNNKLKLGKFLFNLLLQH